jgi:Zn-dependent peptidase ImmA (M78 family)
VSTIDHISRTVAKLCRKYRTRDPYELCNALGVRVRLKDLGTEIKAYYFYQSRIRNVVLNCRVSETVRNILAAHELGHDRLHKEIAMLKGFQEVELFDMARPAEYEANVFAAELLIADDALLELLNDDNKSFFDVARELYIPAALLDFKFRALKHKGYRIEAPYIANGDFLKENIDGCFDEEEY